MTHVSEVLACAGCPMYQSGQQGFVPDELVEDATTFVLGQNPGRTEEAEGRPFVGATGDEMMRTYFPIAGLSRGENVSIGNALRCRWQGTNELPKGKVLQAAVEHCTRAHLRVPARTSLIVAQGAVAWAALGGPKPISSWRGFLAPVSFEGKPILGSLHLADLFRDPKMSHATMKDWEKVRRFHEGRWPLPFPEVNTDSMRVSWVPGMAFDTEYANFEDKSKPTHLLRFSTCDGSRTSVIDREDRFTTLATPDEIVVQNAIGAADLDHYEAIVGAPPTRVDDLLLADALLWSDWPHDLEYLQSVYSPYPKTKHLSKEDPIKYAAGDALDTWYIWHHAIKPQLEADPRSKHIYETRMLPLIPILRRSTKVGIKVDRERGRRALQGLEDFRRDAQHLGQSVVGWPINLGSPKQVLDQLRHDGLKLKSVEHHEVLQALKKDPENALLRARLDWSQAEGFRKFVDPIAERDRVHPSYLPTQATGRISVTDPPLVGFPDDGKAEQRGLPRLRDIFIPDPDTWWLCWDWSAMHARFLAAMARDQDDLAAFANGYDIHLMTVCRVYNLPLPPNLFNAEALENAAWGTQVGWQKGDRRRHLVKTVRYSLLNGLDHRAVLESTEAVEQGLDLNELVKTAKRFLATKSAWTVWKRSYASDAIRVGEARSLYGRRRRLLGASWATRAKAALSGFYQMTEVDIMTETLIEVCRRYPECHLVYPSHDGIKLQFPRTTLPERVVDDVRPWVERSHNFNGVTIPLPAEWEMVDPDGRKSKL